MTTISPYVEINGFVLTGVYPGQPARLHVTYSGLVTPSAGGIKVDEYNYPWRNYATALNSGRQLRKYTVEVASMVRADLDLFLDAVNNAPLDSEFYPESSDRCGYIQIAHAEITKPSMASYNGVWGWWYKALAEITVRGAWMYGPDQGQTLVSNKTIPVTSAFTNNGNLPAGIDYMLAAGGYNTGYIKNLTINSYVTNSNETQGSILLCSQMMRNDRLEVNRWGEVRHQYSTNFPMIYSELQNDFMGGSSYVNYGSGGSIGLNALHIGNSGKIIFPFKGPLPASLPPYLEVWVTSITGTPLVETGNLADLSDLPGISQTLKLGYNKIYLWLQVGQQDIYFGIVTGASDAITISSIKGQVNRYIAPSSMYLVDPGTTFNFAISSSGGTLLSQLEYNYRDLLWF